ncbi:calcium-binding protein [Halocynthiibacter namhaensis]|uniref:calcium-binding protein n=1 Tax=Halocynthiibacter namhaensis TaxID=1290553 RepID=UPI00138DF850|nr:calcium-binding protein [Halocynthiibacter namhaensis]
MPFSISFIANIARKRPELNRDKTIDYDDIIDAGSGADTVDGGRGDDTITGGTGDDTLAGGAGSDTIFGGDDNDLIYGDELPTSSVGVDAGLIDLSYTDIRSGSATQSGTNQAAAGDTVIFDNIGVTSDGRVIYGKLELVEKSDPNLTVDLVGNQFLDIRLNGTNDPGVAGETATFKLSFFDTATDQPISLNGHSVFTDVDQTANGTEVLTLPEDSFSAFGVTSSNTLNISTQNGSTVVTGTTNSAPADQNAWLTAYFENQESVTFTAAARGATTGYSLGPGKADDEIVTPIISSDDIIDAGDGDDVVYGMAGDDTITGGTGDDTISGGTGNDEITGGADDDTVTGGEGDDRFIYNAGDGVDTITDFGADSTNADDGDNTNNDFINLAPFYTNQTEFEADLADDADAQPWWSCGLAV